MPNSIPVAQRVERAFSRRSKYISEFLNRRIRAITSPLRMLPNFLIIGTAKGGTTSLHRYLEEHPNIGCTLKKEVNFYNYNYDKGLGWYRSYFPLQRQGLMAGDSTPTYMIHPHTPSRVFQSIPNVKLIAVLRNPIDRAYSHHNMNLSRQEISENLSFEDAIKAEDMRIDCEMAKMLDDENYVGLNYSYFSYLRSGIYINQLKPWTDLFPRSQILVIQSERLFESPSIIYSQVLEFLNLPKYELKQYKNANPRSYLSDIKPETRKYLADYFRDYNQKLYEFLGATYDWDK
jgi:hypothetical protein